MGTWLWKIRNLVLILAMSSFFCPEALAAVRVGSVGANSGNHAIRTIFSTGDLSGTVQNLSASQYNALTPTELRARFDVLLFTWASPSEVNADWATRILPYLEMGGGVIWEDDTNVSDLAPFVASNLAASWPILEVRPVPGLTDGITNSFANSHIGFSDWSSSLFSFLPTSAGSTGLAGQIGCGRIVLTGPDNDYHASRGDNQYRLLMNEVIWVTSATSACEPLEDSDADGIADLFDNCPSVFNPGQTDADGNGVGDACEPEIDIVDVRPGFDSIDLRIDLFSPTGVPLSGEILLVDGAELQSIELQTLTTCGSDTLTWEMNGVSFAAYPGGGGGSHCTCDAPIESRLISAGSVPGYVPGTVNSLSISKPAGGTNVAWARAVLSYADGSTISSCLFDFGGGGCSNSSFCSAGYSSAPLESSADLGPVGALLRSWSYSESLPTTLDLTGIAPGEYQLIATTTDGTSTASDSELLTIADQQTLRLNADLDGDGVWDGIDADDDNDGVADADDCDPLNPLIHTTGTYYADPDGDGIGNEGDFITVCGNGTPPSGYAAIAGDNCTSTPNPDQTDTDADGTGDACDADDDNDGVADDSDCDTLNPLIHTTGTYYPDPDGDGLGNEGDFITVCGDGTPPPGHVTTAGDNCPTTSNANQADTDGDGIGDACDACVLDPDNDIDEDGVCGDVDNCSTVANADQADRDVDGIGDSCDTDHAPVATDDTASTDEDVPVDIAVLANDDDADGDPRTVTSVSSPAHGTAAINPDGTVRYTPAADYNGSDTFTYSVGDGNGNSDSATVSITVNPVNDAPVAVDDSASGDEDTTITGDVLPNDSDVDGDALTAVLVSDVANGALTLNPDGSFSYSPAANYNGSDSFSYQANDGLLDSNVATVTITVIPVNDAPVLAAIGDRTVDEETMLSFTASASDIDVPADTLTFSLIGAPSGASIDGSSGVFAWTPSESQGPGSYTFTVRVTDDGSPALHAEEEITVSVNEVNVAPVLGAIANGTTQWGDQVTFTATATDHDIPSNTLTFSLSGEPAGASIDGASGVFTWTPASDQIGSHSFDVIVTDDGDPILSDSQSVTITVTKRATTLVYGGDLDEQYSDTTDVLATLTDSGWGTGIDGRTIDFDIGSQSTSALTDAAGVATATITIDQEPGAYFVDALFAGDALYFPSDDSDGYTINQEDAAVTYTGTVFTSTYCETCSGASVLLAATVQDITAATDAPAHDPEAGDVLNATLTFVNRDLASTDSGYVICVAPLGLVNASDPTTAAGTCQWSVDIGNADSVPFTIGMIVDGWYTQDQSEDNTVVTVSKPQRDSITGGGFLINEASAGLKPGQDGKKTNFGFNVKYNKSGKKLQGQINIIVRNEGRVYQLKGNAMSSLSVNPATNQAVFNGKANIQDITDPDNPVSVDGNATLQVEMTDAGEPGDEDTIAITLWDKDGGVWFSSHWNGVRTIEQLLDGGNLQVR